MPRGGITGLDSAVSLYMEKTSGYMDCSCRDCFNGPIMGVAGDMCDPCKKAGCDPDEECQAEGAYGTAEREDVEIWEDRIVQIDCDKHGETTVHGGHVDANGYRCPDCGAECNSTGETGRKGWFWWTCLPGCLPDSDAHGPFDTAEKASADANDE